jgi:hypothetical protein
LVPLQQQVLEAGLPLQRLELGVVLMVVVHAWWRQELLVVLPSWLVLESHFHHCYQANLSSYRV